jgi:excisionase family DNA binding protein
MHDMSNIQPRLKTAANDAEYYTVSEAARLLKVNPSTIWRWIQAKKLPAYRVGPRNIRIKKKDLQTIIKPSRVEEVSMNKERENIWAGYDAHKVDEALDETAGSWADMDTEKLIADLYRAREEGSRPDSRP